MNQEEMELRLGWEKESDAQEVVEYINLKLAALGHPIFGDMDDFKFLRMSSSILANMREKNRLLSEHLPPVDRRIQDFLDRQLSEVFGDSVPRLPTGTFVLDRHGLARCMSLPPDQDYFESDIVKSYRVKQGILNNPKADRRTTKGSFHVAETGFPIPADKIAVPLVTFGKLYELALQPPPEVKELPFTATQEDKARIFVSLMLKPKVIPNVAGFSSEMHNEIRFFAPGTLISNLDFVESIFGNAGDPFLPENDSALDPEGWTGHSGCIILAPQLTKAKKKDVGLPHIDDATEVQKATGMCWESEDELYNNGTPFKITCRDNSGVMVTLIADNYYGYCKKEVKTQIGFSANLHGLAEEEHAGGAVAYASYDLGEDVQFPNRDLDTDHRFEDTLAALGDSAIVQEGGWAIDRNDPNIIYLPHEVRFDLPNVQISWQYEGETVSIKIGPNKTYIMPSGYKVRMERPTETARWSLVGTVAEGVFCHKPCTVSGGGKSEISKSIQDAILYGSFFIVNFHRDFDQVEQILDASYGGRYADPAFNHGENSRGILDPKRSLGSVVKLLTPSDEYTEEYNRWLKGIPSHVKDLVFLIKRYYRDDWGDNWRERFAVDDINGKNGHELKYRNMYIQSGALRIGYNEDTGWRTFGLRKDFYPATKIQTEDDISASVVVPLERIEGKLPANSTRPAYKFINNCEYRLFQRPDEAIHRGYDKTTEHDYAKGNLFFSNYEPLTHDQAKELVQDAIRFSYYTEPMQKVIREYVENPTTDYMISSAHPRLVDGIPTKNPRYLQNRPDLTKPEVQYVSDIGTHLRRRIPLNEPLPVPVKAVLAGRRNNPPDEGVRALCVYNPIHYQELPELFMDFIASLTGKSPSTTGAGSEGALTKGPFNALPPIIDLNNALVSYILTGTGCFSSAAGYVGPKMKVDHDVSLLVPEIWCRMRDHERDPQWLMDNEYMSQCQDFQHNGNLVLGSRLGWRINNKFVIEILGRIFSNPTTVFTESMIFPEKQDMDIFVDGVNNIVEAQKWVAQYYFDDGSVELACPPLKALLHIMVNGEYNGQWVTSEELRNQFTYESMINSDWYAERLDTYQQLETKRLEKIKNYIERYKTNPANIEFFGADNIEARMNFIESRLGQIQSDGFKAAYQGSLGTDPAVS